jgi:iron-sulfur cluster assembly protein
MNLDFTVTAAACDFIKKNIALKNGIGFRLSIKKTGCSGYSYVPAVIDIAHKDDIKIEIKDGITFYVDAACLDILRGVTIDYVEEEKTGLKQKRLVFINPNETSRCGCGESFHIDEE